MKYVSEIGETRVAVSDGQICIQAPTVDMKQIPTADAKITVRIDGVDVAQGKAARLIETLQEARTLAGELASDLNRLEINLK
ncbi:MAG: hypothetical protein VB049_05005 [Candidatus Pelethousia sp.]|nr:hypothetical protein [Candidatus Pelethousia sp.]